MEFEMNGAMYRLAKMSVFDQLKVSRKLLPALAGIFSDINTPTSATDSGSSAALIQKLLPGLAVTLSEMREEDTNAILFPCLSVISRQQGKSWTPIFGDGVLLFDDIDLKDMLLLAGRVVGDSLGNFLLERPASGTAA